MDPSSVLSGVNTIVCAMIVALVGAFRAAFPEFFRSRRGRRVLPFLPLALGAVFGAAGLCDTTMFREPSRLASIVTGALCGALGASAKTVYSRLTNPEGEPREAGAGGRRRGEADPADDDAPGA